MLPMPWQSPAAGPADAQTASRRLSDVRTLLIACPYFVLERIDLEAYSNWQLNAPSETWLLVLDGHAQVGPTSQSIGKTALLEADRATIQVGAGRFSGLVAYVSANPLRSLLRTLTGRAGDSLALSSEVLS
jgi:mannose-6-phosphate isomerase